MKKKNVLALGAHFDDVELGAGGTVIKHVKNGDNVILAVVTDSAYYNYDGTTIRTLDVAKREGEDAAKILGVSRLISLGLPTKTLTYGFELIEQINKIIDDHKIEIIYTHWDKDVHQDHSAIGRATFNAGRHVQNILMYRSNWYQTSCEFRGNYFVDISENIAQKVEAVKAHANEYQKFGPGWVDFFVNENANAGKKIGVKYAEAFEVVKVLV
jgi:LmbE family N-acetylglucosaminyl deacetylase